MTLYVIAALLGNAWRESHVNPNALQGSYSGAGFGLFQWSGSRRTNLEEYLNSRGLELTDGNGQLDFLIYEGDWIQNIGSYTTLNAFLDSDSTDIDYLTEIFMTNWERPGKPYLEERQKFANAAFDYLMNTTPIITDYHLTPRYYLSWNQALENSYLVFQHLNGVRPDDPVYPPTPTPPIDPDWQGLNTLIYYKGVKNRRKREWK